MNNFGKTVITVLSVVMIICLSCITAAAQADYTYTITFYAGTQGAFGSTNGLFVEGASANVSQSDEKIVITGLEAGDKVSFTAQSAITMDNDSKHYVKGVRLSGYDNNTVSASVFSVDSDRDYVVAYGIKGDTTKYTIRYQDADTNTLIEDDVFYGNVGDKPVVAYKYIEGYEPRVLGFTKTLSENEADNVFTFLYDKIPETVVETPEENPNGETEETPENDQDQDENAENAPENGQDDEENTENDEPQNPTEEQNPAVNEEEQTQNDENDKETQNQNPDEGPNTEIQSPNDIEVNKIVDLDDEEVPLANVDAEPNKNGIPMGGMIAIIVIALVGIANAIFLIKRRFSVNK